MTVVSYKGGNSMALLPNKGKSVHSSTPFNAKEHLAIVIMSRSASGVARAT
jgi:hypothetical protein